MTLDKKIIGHRTNKNEGNIPPGYQSPVREYDFLHLSAMSKKGSATYFGWSREPILDGQENPFWMVKKTHFGWSRKPMAVIFT